MRGARYALLSAVALLLAATPPARAGDDAIGGSGDLEPATGPGSLRRLVLKGTPYQMGWHHGRLLRDEVRALASSRLDPKVEEATRGNLERVRGALSAPVAEELKGLAGGAGVKADDLLVREAAREEARWLHPDEDVFSASWCLESGVSPRVFVGYEHAASGAARSLLLVERRPTGGTATLVLGWSGGLGALAGCTSRGLYGAQSEQPGLDRARVARDKWQGSLFAVSFRTALESASKPVAVFDALPRLAGNRVLVGMNKGTLLEGMVPAEGEKPREFENEEGEGSFMPSRSDLKEPPPRLHEAMREADEKHDPALVLFAVRPKDADGPVFEVTPDRLILRPPSGKPIEYVLK